MSSRLPYLRDVPPSQLPDLMVSWGQPPFRGQQLNRWLYRENARHWDHMTNLPLALRHRLATSYQLCSLEFKERFTSRDGTRKFLFTLHDNSAIESVMIPMESHATFCLSSQVGCRMACRFCATARGGLDRQLRTSEILEQVILLRHDLADNPFAGHGERQFNLVFMGMGEPLDNWKNVSAAVEVMLAKEGFGISARRVTVSTSGHAPLLEKMLDFPHPIGLTISLSGTSEKTRRQLMPLASRTPLNECLNLAERYAVRTHRRVTIAYVLVAGISDSLAEAERLVRHVRGRPFKINLIPLNKIDKEKLIPSKREHILRFQNTLSAAGIPAFIRESGGQDIAAACGQLRNRHVSGSASSAD